MEDESTGLEELELVCPICNEEGSLIMETLSTYSLFKNREGEIFVEGSDSPPRSSRIKCNTESCNHSKKVDVEDFEWKW